MNRPAASNGKILIFAQFWKGDLDAMMSLLGLIADIQPGFCDIADIALLPKVDAMYRKNDVPKKLRDKFKVLELKGSRWASGWPMGPNALAMDAFKLAHENWKSGAWDYSGYFLMESDAIPMSNDWIARIRSEWDSHDKPFMGYEIFGPHHINGNLMFHPCIFDEHKHMAYGPTTTHAWDAVWAKEILANSFSSKTIYSDYRLNTQKNKWKGCDFLWEQKNGAYPAYFHGIKGDIGLKCVRQRLKKY